MTESRHKELDAAFSKIEQIYKEHDLHGAFLAIDVESTRYHFNYVVDGTKTALDWEDDMIQFRKDLGTDKLRQKRLKQTGAMALYLLDFGANCYNLANHVVDRLANQFGIHRRVQKPPEEKSQIIDPTNGGAVIKHL